MSNTKIKMPDHSAALALEVGVQAGGGLNKSYATVGSKDSTYRILIQSFEVSKIVSYHLGF